MSPHRLKDCCTSSNSPVHPAPEEIVDGHLNRNARGYRPLPEVRQDGGVFLDATGLGAGVYDRLRELKYKQVEAINFAQSPIDDRKWSNKRAEMWGLLGEWLARHAT